MNNRSYISDELLNSLIDDQLDAEDREQIFAQIAKDPALNKRVCELRSCRELVQLAYRNVPPAPIRSKALSATHPRNPWISGIAASVLVGVGVLIGTQLNITQTGGEVPIAVSNDAAATRVAVSSIATTKVLFHLNSGDPEVGREALDELEGVLNYYESTGEKAIIELITNGGGIDLLRSDTSPFADRVLAMQKRYPNLTFITCQNTIDRLKRERGITAKLLPGIVVIDSGVAQIMRRQQEGWAYIQV
ncbi:MAG: hypothetical protein ACC641_04435 [Acidiferrobacterales bacterium]